MASRVSPGVWWGLVGIFAFSFTVPFTRVAVAGLSPLFVGSARAVIAGTLATLALVLTKQKIPSLSQWLRLAIVGGGVVIGFPFFTSFALQHVPASHGAVVIGLLPAVTAIFAVIRAKERPKPLFWIFAALGAVATIVFISLQQGGIGQLHWADLMLLGAVVTAAIGYAEGAMLSREIGSWQTISWALIVMAPITVLLTVISLGIEPPHATAVEWLAFSYTGFISMFLGFFAWYRGLAIGPVTTVSQVQLVQPVFSICWAALFLGEHIDLTTLISGLVVIAFAGSAVRVRLQSPKL